MWLVWWVVVEIFREITEYSQLASAFFEVWLGSKPEKEELGGSGFCPWAIFEVDRVEVARSEVVCKT